MKNREQKAEESEIKSQLKIPIKLTNFLARLNNEKGEKTQNITFTSEIEEEVSLLILQK